MERGPENFNLNRSMGRVSGFAASRVHGHILTLLLVAGRELPLCPLGVAACNAALPNVTVSRCARLASSVFFLLLGAITAWSDPKHPASPAQIVVEQEYDDAKSRYETNQADTVSAWQYVCA